MNRAPNFWWDFDGGAIIVESDIGNLPVIAAFPYAGISAEREIAKAEKLIGDLKSGRRTIKEVMQ